jgi:hypothetical protein
MKPSSSTGRMRKSRNLQMSPRPLRDRRWMKMHTSTEFRTRIFNSSSRESTPYSVQSPNMDTPLHVYGVPCSVYSRYTWYEVFSYLCAQYNRPTSTVHAGKPTPYMIVIVFEIQLALKISMEEPQYKSREF